MNLPPIPTIPESVTGRQALTAIRGYAYQLYATAIAWLNLCEDAQLLVEVAEDYAIAASNALQATGPRQPIGPNDAPQPGRVRNDKYFLDAAAGYSVYLTTSTVGREKGLWFPGERGGLEYWLEAVSPESDLRPLRAVLDTLSLHSELRAWVRAATDAQVRESNCWHESNGSMER